MTALQVLNGIGATALPSPRENQRGRVDLVVDGINLTARIPAVDCAPLLRDLASATTELASLQSRRVAVRCHSAEAPWELGIERSGDGVLVSLFRGGQHPEVAIFEREVRLASLMNAVRSALEDLEPTGMPAPLTVALERAKAELARAQIIPEGAASMAQVEVAPEGEGGLRFSASFGLRERPARKSCERTVERTDLFGLLVRGTLGIAVGERALGFADTFVFLFAEQLLSLASEALDAWEQGRSYYRRLTIAGVLLGVRIGSNRESPERECARGAPRRADPGLWLTLGEPHPAARADARTFKIRDALTLVEAAVSFGRSLARVLVRHDPTQRQNLRLSAFRRAVRLLDDRLRDATCDDAKVNPAPEMYRAYAAPEPPAAPREAAKLRFSAGWTATFPALDLRATFLCGDHLIVGASRETACLERRSGEFLWRKATTPAVSVVTPLGLARLFADGSIALHDFGSGEVALTVRLSPRVGGVVTGAVVSSPGLPRLLVVSEGKRCVSAVDLGTGEVRWRYTAHGGSVFRLRRAGKLLVVVAKDATLTALDLWSGDVVWRARDRLRFASHVGLDHESLFAAAGEPDGRGRGTVRLYHLDPYAGVTRWVRELPEGPSPLGAPLVTDREVILVTRDRRGLGLLALDRATGETLWASDPGLFPVASAWLAIDDGVVINSEAGDLLSLSARTGATRWRHRFPRGMEGDQPRKLEPILRSGALFVPQQQVHVVRPRDGAILGCVPTELIPDLLRVDEHCDVYVAEESGHLAAFRAGAKLSVV